MGGAWDLRRAVAVALGGAVGATVRWAALASAGPLGPPWFPWSVLVVNLAGSFVLGVVLAEEWTHPGARLLLHDALGIGFCGGLTTFSTFSADVVGLVRDGHPMAAAVYAAVSVAGAIVGVVAGAAVLRRVRAVSLPLEERP